MKSSKLQLFMIAFTFAVLMIAAVPEASAGCTEGSIRNHTHGCCGINNKKHSWEECHNNQWFLISYCDYSDCCAYPCAVAATEMSFPWLKDGGLLNQLLRDEAAGGCQDQTIRGLWTTTPTEEAVPTEEMKEPVRDLDVES